MAASETNSGKKIGIVCTVGTRDLTLDGKTAADFASIGKHEYGSPRKLGKAILDNWDDMAERIAFPIIQPVLDYARQKARSEDAEVGYLLLIATDQPEVVDAEHREKDTLHIAEVAVRHFMMAQYRPSKSFVAKPMTYSLNPTRMDSAWSYLHDVSSKACFRELENCSQVILSTTGGVPGLNQALLLFLFSEVCGRKLAFVHVDEKLKKPMPIEIVQQLCRLETIHRLEAYAASFDFAAMARELSGVELEGMRKVALSASRRLTFDFQGAEHLLMESFPHFKSQKAETALRRWVDQLTLLSQSSQEREQAIRARRYLLQELVANVFIKIQREEWVDFLGRWYRLIEETMKQFVSEYLELPLLYDGKQYSDYVQAVENRDDIKAFFAGRKGPNGKPLDWSELNTRTGEAWVEFIADHPLSGKEDLSLRSGLFLGMLKRFGHLVSLRNKCILAHGNRGVGKQDILDALGGLSIEEFRQQLSHTILNITNPDEVEKEFRDILEFIQTALKEG